MTNLEKFKEVFGEPSMTKEMAEWSWWEKEYKEIESNGTE